MERLNQSTNGYIKSISRRDQGEGKDKQLPVGHFASVLVNHGEDFEPDSEFGQCLTQLGRANERIARMQETYVANATSSWIEGTERSLAQMKEYQKSKQKLESRRLALDTAQVKLQKSKREDFRAEEELRSQKAKYEESSEEVYRRMFDIKEAEADSIADLTAFLEAELTYYDRCREVLMQIRRDWPSYVSQSSTIVSLNTNHFPQNRPTQLPLRRRLPHPKPRPPPQSLALQHRLLPQRPLQPHNGRTPARPARQNQLPHPLRPELPAPRTARLRLLHTRHNIRAPHPLALLLRLRGPDVPRQHAARRLAHAPAQPRADGLVADLERAVEFAGREVEGQRVCGGECV